MSDRVSKAMFLGLAAATLHPRVPSGVALLAGAVFAIVLENPFWSAVRRWTTPLLQLSVVGLGAGMNLEVVGRVGVHGIGYTAVGITVTLFAGIVIGKLLRVERDTSLLVASGTAICGGSAIAAVAPVLGAKGHQVAVALATVFLLNAAALLVFPGIGHALHLDQNQFGLWSALAIHDTSSVVGASLQYGARALEVATTVKLARALWIIPLAIGIALWRARRGAGAGATVSRVKKPWFILGFVAVSALVTWIPEIRSLGDATAFCARRALVLTLFLIGTSLTRATLREVGARPFLQGFALWILVSLGSAWSIVSGWVHL